MELTDRQKKSLAVLGDQARAEKNHKMLQIGLVGFALLAAGPILRAIVSFIHAIEGHRRFRVRDGNRWFRLNGWGLVMGLHGTTITSPQARKAPEGS